MYIYIYKYKYIILFHPHSTVWPKKLCPAPAEIRHASSPASFSLPALALTLSGNLVSVFGRFGGSNRWDDTYLSISLSKHSTTSINQIKLDSILICCILIWFDLALRIRCDTKTCLQDDGKRRAQSDVLFDFSRFTICIFFDCISNHKYIYIYIIILIHIVCPGFQSFLIWWNWQHGLQSSVWSRSSISARTLWCKVLDLQLCQLDASEWDGARRLFPSCLTIPFRCFFDVFFILFEHVFPTFLML